MEKWRNEFSEVPIRFIASSAKGNANDAASKTKKEDEFFGKVAERITSAYRAKKGKANNVASSMEPEFSEKFTKRPATTPQAKGEQGNRKGRR